MIHWIKNAFRLFLSSLVGLTWRINLALKSLSFTLRQPLLVSFLQYWSSESGGKWLITWPRLYSASSPQKKSLNYAFIIYDSWLKIECSLYRLAWERKWMIWTALTLHASFCGFSTMSTKWGKRFNMSSMRVSVVCGCLTAAAAPPSGMPMSIRLVEYWNRPI